MNKKFYIVLVIVALIVGILIGKYAFNGSLTGSVVSNAENNRSYSWTTAICDDKNRCVDVLIECENGNVKNLTPVSDLNEFSDNWTDPRSGKLNYCE